MESFPAEISLPSEYGESSMAQVDALFDGGRAFIDQLGQMSSSSAPCSNFRSQTHSDIGSSSLGSFKFTPEDTMDIPLINSDMSLLKNVEFTLGSSSDGSYADLNLSLLTPTTRPKLDPGHEPNWNVNPSQCLR